MYDMTFVTESEMKRCNISSIKRKCHSELVQYSSFIAVLKLSIENLFHSISNISNISARCSGRIQKIQPQCSGEAMDVRLCSAFPGGPSRT